MRKTKNLSDDTMDSRINFLKENKRDDQVTELILDNCRATHISGLTDEFVNLESLSLINVGLDSLTGFPKLPKLKKLELSGNRLTDGLDFLQGSPKLQHLNISGNRVKDLVALEPLKQFHDLSNLDLYNCEVTKSDDYRKRVFELLPNLHSLDGLDVVGNKIDDLEDLDREDESQEENINQSADNDLNQKVCYKSSGSFSKNLIIFLLVVIAFLYTMYEERPLEAVSNRETQIQLNLEQVGKLKTKYPSLISAKEMRIIETRLAVMGKEVSILMLLGRSKDGLCREDPTFCVGQTIANVTQKKFGYIDASNPNILTHEIQRELNHSLAGNRYTVMVDSLEQLPASEVMNLFQFIDKDQFQTHSRGLLIFVVYAGTVNQYEDGRLREAEIAEKVLFDKWSPFIPKDSLTSVISRICSSIIKVY